MYRTSLKKSILSLFVCFLGAVFIYQMSFSMDTSPQPKVPHKVAANPFCVWVSNLPRNRTTPKPATNLPLPMNKTTISPASNSSNLFRDIQDFIKGIPKETGKKGKKSNTNLFAFISKILNETQSHDEQKQQYFK